MTTDRCQQYLEDPEAHPAHIAECASCRALAEDLRSVEAGGVNVPELPLAPWEGAAYRSWPLVAGAVLTVMALAAGFFAVGGASPMVEIGKAVQAGFTSTATWAALASTAGGALRHAPAKLQILIGLSFVLINVLLFALLRRAPKGIDV